MSVGARLFGQLAEVLGVASDTRGLARYRGWAAALYLAVQLGGPAAYYLRADPRDERFSWRMASSWQGERCQPVVEVAGQPVVLEMYFHEDWIALARRGRRAVLVAMGHHLCRLEPRRTVTVELSCQGQGSVPGRFHRAVCAGGGRGE